MKEEIKWRKSKGFTQKIAEIKSYMDALTIGG